MESCRGQFSNTADNPNYYLKHEIKQYKHRHAQNLTKHRTDRYNMSLRKRAVSQPSSAMKTIDPFRIYRWRRRVCPWLRVRPFPWEAGWRLWPMSQTMTEIFWGTKSRFHRRRWLRERSCALVRTRSGSLAPTRPRTCSAVRDLRSIANLVSCYK